MPNLVKTIVKTVIFSSGNYLTKSPWSERVKYAKNVYVVLKQALETR